MNGSLIKLLAAALAVASLAGCASMSKKECMVADWQDVGIRDGANGRPEEYLIQHSTACAKVGVTPDRDRWLQGRERGLERFCVPHRAYQAGESGGSFDVGMCRGFDQDRLADAYEKGHEVNVRAGELAAIDDEIRSIHATLDNEKIELEKKERERLAFRLGVLAVTRVDAQRAYDDARYRARDL